MWNCTASHYKIINVNFVFQCKKELGPELEVTSLNENTFDLEAQKDYTINQNSYMAIDICDIPIPIGQRKIESII